MTRYDTLIIDGILYEYSYTANNLHIYGSYKVSKRDMEGALYAIEIRHPELSIWQQELERHKREWATHNLCYSLGLFRSRTADVDLNYPNKWDWLYNIIGAVALLIIK